MMINRSDLEVFYVQTNPCQCGGIFLHSNQIAAKKRMCSKQIMVCCGSPLVIQKGPMVLCFRLGKWSNRSQDPEKMALTLPTVPQRMLGNCNHPHNLLQYKNVIKCGLRSVVSVATEETDRQNSCKAGNYCGEGNKRGPIIFQHYPLVN